MLNALIFDVDGTLADTERDGHRVAFNLAFADAGLDWNWSESEYGDLLRVTGGRERLRHFAERERLTIDESFIDDLHARKTRHYVRLMHEGAIRLRPGVIRLLTEAHRAGIALAIATTTTRINVESLLTRALPHQANWFGVIGAAEDAAPKKPDPAIYRFVLDRLGIRGQDCIAFEDSEAGLQSALAANVPTVVTVNDYTRGQDFFGALAVVDDLDHSAAIGATASPAGLVDLATLRAWHSQGIKP